jgi:hypothetical protein
MKILERLKFSVLKIHQIINEIEALVVPILDRNMINSVVSKPELIKRTITSELLSMTWLMNLHIKRSSLYIMEIWCIQTEESWRKILKKQIQ